MATYELKEWVKKRLTLDSQTNACPSIVYWEKCMNVSFTGYDGITHNKVIDIFEYKDENGTIQEGFMEHFMFIHIFQEKTL